MSESPALQVFQLNVNYDQTTVLCDITLSIAKGNLIGIIGPNGAGKSTLIKATLGLVKPLSGKIEFFGKKLRHFRKQIAYIPQRETVDWDFPITVRDLVLMGRYGHLGLLRWPKKADREAVDHYLEVVGMRDYAHRQISQLSGGQQQRAFLARALLQEAEIYFMDEPFTGIDLGTEAIIMDILRKLKAKEKTIFIIHHDLNNVVKYFDCLIMLNKRLIACGSVQDVFKPETLNMTYEYYDPFFNDVFNVKCF